MPPVPIFCRIWNWPFRMSRPMNGSGAAIGRAHVSNTPQASRPDGVFPVRARAIVSPNCYNRPRCRARGFVTRSSRGGAAARDPFDSLHFGVVGARPGVLAANVRARRGARCARRRLYVVTQVHGRERSRSRRRRSRTRCSSAKRTSSSRARPASPAASRSPIAFRCWSPTRKRRGRRDPQRVARHGGQRGRRGRDGAPARDRARRSDGGDRSPHRDLLLRSGRRRGAALAAVCPERVVIVTSRAAAARRSAQDRSRAARGARARGRRDRRRPRLHQVRSRPLLLFPPRPREKWTPALGDRGALVVAVTPRAPDPTSTRR